MGSEEERNGFALGDGLPQGGPADDIEAELELEDTTEVMERPSPRLIRSPEDAEVAAAEWTRWLGFPDAHVTGRGADGGVDIRGKSVVGQVKAHMGRISRPDLQRLYGVAQAEKRLPLFFSLMSYTEQSIRWADSVGMALFRFNHAGEVEPVNKSARTMFERAELDPVAAPGAEVNDVEAEDTDPYGVRGGAARGGTTGPETPPVPASIWAYPLVCDDDLARSALIPQRRRGRQSDQLQWLTQGWMLVAGLRFGYTYWTQVRQPVERFGMSRTAFELRHGEWVDVPPSLGALQAYPETWLTITPGLTADGLAAYISDRWNRLLGLVQPSAQERAWQDLGRFGIPRGVGNLAVHVEGVFMIPFFSAFFTSQSGNYFTAMHGSTGAMDPRLGTIFTRYAPDLYPFLASGRRLA